MELVDRVMDQYHGMHSSNLVFLFLLHSLCAQISESEVQDKCGLSSVSLCGVCINRQISCNDCELIVLGMRPSRLQDGIVPHIKPLCCLVVDLKSGEPQSLPFL